jgi:hypothetical protein
MPPKRAESKTSAASGPRALELFARHRLSPALETLVLSFLTTDVLGDVALLSKTTYADVIALLQAAEDVYVSGATSLKNELPGRTASALSLILRHCCHLRSIVVLDHASIDRVSFSILHHDWMSALIRQNQRSLRAVLLPPGIEWSELTWSHVIHIPQLQRYRMAISKEVRCERPANLNERAFCVGVQSYSRVEFEFGAKDLMTSWLQVRMRYCRPRAPAVANFQRIRSRNHATYCLSSRHS